MKTAPAVLFVIGRIRYSLFVSMEAKVNKAYQKRLEYTAKLLGKDQEVQKVDEETGEVTIVKKKAAGKPITKEDAQMLEYKALVSEGRTLYAAKEFQRAIDAFTQAMEKQKDDHAILIDRANCYIGIGQPEDALKDVNNVLGHSSNNPRAILTKAEAYFSMGEFEFALVFFQRGHSIRKDIVGFRDGITKARSAISDSIEGTAVFQANPNYAESRPRKALVDVPEDASAPKPPDPEKLKKTADLLPEKVEPLSMSSGQKQFLRELSLDYDYLIELREEVRQGASEDQLGKKEDEQILAIVEEALVYLEQRSAFWSQQGQDDSAPVDTTEKQPTSGAETKPSTERKAGSKTAHYEMSKIQQYEAKYGSADRKAKSGSKPDSAQAAAAAEE
jgi:tetratricopeptide (TPR) repeat protein